MTQEDSLVINAIQLKFFLFFAFIAIFKELIVTGI